jgi:ABC transporter transmembrane region
MDPGHKQQTYLFKNESFLSKWLHLYTNKVINLSSKGKFTYDDLFILDEKYGYVKVSNEFKQSC